MDYNSIQREGSNDKGFRSILNQLAFVIIFYINARDNSIIRLLTSSIIQIVLTQIHLLKLPESPQMAKLGLRLYIVILALNNSLGHWIDSIGFNGNPLEWEKEGIISQWIGESKAEKFPMVLTMDILLLSLQIFLTCDVSSIDNRVSVDI